MGHSDAAGAARAEQFISPSIGRIVHYHSLDYLTNPQAPQVAARAALVTGIRAGGRADLHVFTPTGVDLFPDVGYDGSMRPGTWCWPPGGPGVTGSGQSFTQR